MSLTHLLPNQFVFSRRPDSRRKKPAAPAKFRPALETLEARRLMSAGGTLTVVNTLDSGAGSLRAQITAAHNGDSIVFAASLAGQTITLTSGELLIKQNITIAGPADRNVTISGGGHSRVLDVSKTVRNALLSGLTISNGSANGPTNITIQGGGIYNAGTLTVSNTTLSYNTANNNGGGIANDGTLTVSRCDLLNNSVPQGNTGGVGGGIANFGTLAVSGSTMSGNSAPNGYGGGIYNDGYNQGPSTISGSILSGNSAWGGGGIYDGAGTLNINGSILSGNSAYVGGGIYNYHAILTLSGSILSGNVAAYSGGGIYMTGGVSPYGSVTLKNSSSITGNTAPIGFGADVYNNGVLDADSSSILHIGILDGNAVVLI